MYLHQHISIYSEKKPNYNCKAGVRSEDYSPHQIYNGQSAEDSAFRLVQTEHNRPAGQLLSEYHLWGHLSVTLIWAVSRGGAF